MLLSHSDYKLHGRGGSWKEGCHPPSLHGPGHHCLEGVPGAGTRLGKLAPAQHWDGPRYCLLSHISGFTQCRHMSFSIHNCKTLNCNVTCFANLGTGTNVSSPYQPVQRRISQATFSNDTNNENFFTPKEEYQHNSKKMRDDSATRLTF